MLFGSKGQVCREEDRTRRMPSWFPVPFPMEVFGTTHTVLDGLSVCATPKRVCGQVGGQGIRCTVQYFPPWC
eukprot:m.413480 g.413480  ORF g.413480 m.413480 type:complete len:72 (+) comp29107_c0_seq1:280-495(+)